jgi:hypothetical protein
MGVNSGLADVLADVCVQPKRSFYNDGCGLCMQKCEFVLNAANKCKRKAGKTDRLLTVWLSKKAFLASEHGKRISCYQSEAGP